MRLKSIRSARSATSLMLGGIFLLAILLRAWHINEVPVGITHDELDYYLGGKFLSLTGSDFTGTWKWWQLSPMKTGTLTAELTPLYYIPVGLLFQSSLLTAKLTPILVGSLLVFLMYGLMYRISKGNRRLALVTALLMAINPWSIIFSRTGYEVTFAIFWYLLAIVAYSSIDLNRVINRKNIIWLAIALAGLFLGYFSYHGFKFLAPFVAIGAIIGQRLIQGKEINLKSEIFFSGLFMFLPLFLMMFSLLNYSSYGNRVSEISLFQINTYADSVNHDRKLSITNPITPLLLNKATAYGKDMLTTYLQFFSFDRLFLATHDGYNLTFPDQGYFYFIEIIFIAIGFAYALRKKEYTLLFLLLFVAPIPSVIHNGVSYALRSAFAMIPLIGLSAIGLYNLMTKARAKPVSLGIGVLLVLSFGYFAFTYLYRYSIISADQYMINARLVSSYLTRSISTQPTTVLTDSSYELFRDYLFYSQGINRNNAKSIQHQFTSGLYADYQLPNLLVTSNCEILKSPPDGTVIVDTLFYTGCLQSYKLENADFKSDLEKRPSISLRSPLDSREYYKIFNASYCESAPHQTFIMVKNLKDLDIEQQSDQDFCSTWIF